jgi:hypothetical protein
VTKWERIFRSWHPGATIESQRNNGPGGKRNYLVRREAGAFHSVGEGVSKALAWQAACDLLRLDKEKK